MGTAIRSGDTKETVGAPVAWPSIESLDETVRKARRAISNARNVTEDFAAGASLEVRRHPLTAVGFATTAGILTGCLFGFAAGWFIGRRG